MRKVWNSSLLVLVLVAAFVAVGCAKPPDEDMNAANQAVSDAKAAEADAYASSELASAQGSLDSAKTEIEAQKQKWFPNYDKAKEFIATAKKGAETAKTTAAANKD